MNEAMQQVFYCSRQILDGRHTVPISTFSPIAGPQAAWCACGLSLELLCVIQRHHNPAVSASLCECLWVTLFKLEVASNNTKASSTQHDMPRALCWVKPLHLNHKR